MLHAPIGSEMYATHGIAEESEFCFVLFGDSIIWLISIYVVLGVRTFSLICPQLPTNQLHNFSCTTNVHLSSTHRGQHKQNNSYSVQTRQHIHLLHRAAANIRTSQSAYMKVKWLNKRIKNDLFRYTTKSSIVWISIIVVFISNDFSHIDPTEHYPKMTENKTAVDCIFYYCLFFRLHDWNELAWRVRETNRGNWRMWWQPHSILSGRKVPYILSSLSITRTAEKSIPIYASLRAHEHIAWALLNTELMFVSSTRQNHVLRGCTTERDAPSSAGHRCHMEYSDC